jgi:hypothetical protein
MSNNPILSVVLDGQAIENILMDRTNIDVLIHDSSLPDSDAFTKCIRLGDCGYIVSRKVKSNDKLVVISLKSDGPLLGISAAAREDALDRTLRCALVGIAHRGTIPVSWRPFHTGNIVSFQSSRKGTTETARILVEFTAEKTPHAYVFAIDREKSDLTKASPDYDIFINAVLGFEDAISLPEPAQKVGEEGNGTVHLSSQLLGKDTHKLSFDDWYKSRLTEDQLKFVNHPLVQSIRVIGPAGSGKTVSLVVKALREIRLAKATGFEPKFLFLTHAAINADVVHNLVAAMDPDQSITRNSDDQQALDITTIYSLANKHMHYDLEGLEPLSLDGQEGRNLQAELISTLISDFEKSDWIAYRSGCSNEFQKLIGNKTEPNQRNQFISELMNEFACVLDADGIKNGADRTKQYLDGERRRWMMALQSRDERSVVLELYFRFRAQLRDMNTIGVDQMVSDYLNFLDSNKWEILRAKHGYDAIFVDELHLFNRIERMIFRHLTKDATQPPVVVMAYDPKQSPRDTFSGISAGAINKKDFLREASVGPTEKYELADVFRYSPEIVRLLELLDNSFPGQDLDDEWPAYKGVSQTANGPKPKVIELRSSRELFDYVFPRAKAMQKSIDKGKKIAVLCASNTMFNTYADASKYADDFSIISSRDDLSKIKSNQKKFIFSAPEYVAGLQFDTVLLIEANRNEVPSGPYSASAMRKFVSTLYLGASRAEIQLEIYCTKEGGGLSPVFDHALNSDAIEFERI